MCGTQSMHESRCDAYAGLIAALDPNGTPKAKTRWRWSWQHAGAEIRICDILNVARVVGVRQHALAVISRSTEIASDCCNARRDQNKPDRRQMLS
jgi:hypothetical protein